MPVASQRSRFSATNASSAELGVGPVDAVDLLCLARAQVLRRVEAPAACEQALPAQDLVAARDHAVERVRDVEERGVAVRDGAVERQQVGGDGIVAATARQRSRISTAVRVHTDQWPSRPPTKRSSPAGVRNGTVRSSTMWSSLPV